MGRARRAARRRARAGRGRPRPRPAAVVARSPSERASASTCGPPASSWKAPALPRRTSRTSGVPGSGRKPTSPAPPVAPPWSRPSITIGGTEALVGPQQHEVVDAPRRDPAASSATAARLTSLSTWIGMPTASASRSSRCGVVPAGQVAGVAQPPRRGVEGARCADREVAQAGRPAARPDVAAPSSALHDVAHRVGSRAARGAQLVLADGAAGDVGDRGQDPGRRDVERGHVGGVGVDGVELGARPGTAVGVAAGDHQAGALQPGQQLAARSAWRARSARRAGTGTAARARASRSRAARSLMPRSSRGVPGLTGRPLAVRTCAWGRRWSWAAAAMIADTGHVEGRLVGLPGAYVVDVAAAVAVERGQVRATPRCSGACRLEAAEAALEVAGSVGAVDHGADVDRRGAVEAAREVGDLVLHAVGERVPIPTIAVTPQGSPPSSQVRCAVAKRW